MTKRIILLTIILTVSWFAVPGAAETKVVPLPELLNPKTMDVDGSQLYVTQDPEIYIYSLKDFKLIKKFGQKGQGPGEFSTHPLLPLILDVKGDQIIVNSIMKISYFSKKGEFISEKKAQSMALGVKPIGDKFLGTAILQEEGVRYKAVNLYDSNLKKVKEIYRFKDDFQAQGQGIKIMRKPFTYAGDDKRILLPGDDDETINVFDHDMKKLFSIKIDGKRTKVDQEFKDALINHFKTTPGLKEQYELIKPIIIPDYFPVYFNFFIENNLINVMRWKTASDDRIEYLLYDLNGKFKERKLVPIQFETPVKPYPVSTHKGKLYQLVENMDEEQWELHISDY